MLTINCVRCDKEMNVPGTHGTVRRYCQECADKNRREGYLIATDKRRVRDGLPWLDRCVRCGNEREKGRYYCPACERAVEIEKAKRPRRRLSQEDMELLELSVPGRYSQTQEPHWSARFSGSEIDRIAKENHTSYGKMRAWLDYHKRLPYKGEQLF